MFGLTLGRGHRSSSLSCALFLLLLISFHAKAASAGGSSRPFHNRHLLASLLQQTVQPGLELAQRDVPWAQSPDPAAQSKELQSPGAPPAANRSSTPVPPNATAAAPPADSSSPQDPAAWQRRTMQLPPHVYLISFVMLLAIMAALLSCHCYRMCRIARRMRQAAELGITLSPAGATLNKRTPQAVIEALPVSKYSRVHSLKASSRTASHSSPSQRHTVSSSAVAATATGPAAAAAAATAAAAGSTQAAGEASSSKMSSFFAAALQIREQVARQTGISTAPGGSSSSTEVEITPATAAAAAASSSAATERTAPPAAATAGGASLLTTTVSFKSLNGAAAGAIAAAAGSAGSMHGGQSSSSNGAEPCAICFDEFAADDDVKQLPCGHYFHPVCIDEWLVRDITCPLCKGMVLDEALVEQQELMAEALQGSLISSTNPLTRQLRARAAQQQLQELADQEPSGTNSRRRRLRRLRRQAQSATDASVAGSNAAEGGSRSGDQAVAAGTGAAAAGPRQPRSSGTVDDMFDLLHMVMLGIPRASHARSAAAAAAGDAGLQQQQQAVQQAASSRRSDSDSGPGQRRSFRGLFTQQSRRENTTSTAAPPAAAAAAPSVDVELGLHSNGAAAGRS